MNKKIRLLEIERSYFMPVAGLEPARGCPRQILSLLRLPFRHTGVCRNDMKYSNTF